MPGYVRGTPRDQMVFVPINATLHYGWKSPDLAALSGISAADLKTQLGHMSATEAAAVAGALLVLGANSPKPARYTKKFPAAPTSQRGSVSTFAAFNKAAAAVGAGWTQSGRAKSVRLTAATANKRSQTAVAELSNGLLYAFPMPVADFTLVSADLGLQAAGQISALEAAKLATGMKGTRPGKVSIEDSGGLLTTYFSTANLDEALAAGFSLVEGERIQFPSAI